jgi:hypothetical protein
MADLLEPPGEVCEIDANLADVERALGVAPGLVVPVVEDRRSMRLVAELGADAVELARRRYGADIDWLRAADIAQPAVGCELADPPEAALAIMRAHRRTALHVVDAEGRLRGTVSIERMYLCSDPIARLENAPGSLRTALVPVGRCEPPLVPPSDAPLAPLVEASAGRATPR